MTAAPSAAPRPSRWIPLVVACAFFMESLDSTIITTSIPEIARSLGESSLRLHAAVTSYLLSLAVFIPISGWFADRFGPRTVFSAAIVTFTVGSALCGASTSLEMLVATRVLQGFGGAMMSPVGRLILLRSFPKHEMVAAMSYVAIPAMVGPTVGPVIGGLLTTYLSWRWIFYINIPIGLAGIALAFACVANLKAAAPARFDFVGFAIVGLGLAQLELGIESLGRPLIPAGGQVGLFAGAGLTLWIYQRYAARHANPALDLSLFGLRTFRIAVLWGSLSRAGIAAAPFLLPLLFQLGFGLSPVQSGLLTFIASLGAILMKTVAPTILRTFGFRRLLAGNAVVVAALIGGLALFSAQTPHWLILGYLLTFGFLRTVQFTALNALGYADVSPAMMSRGTSLGSVAQQLSMGLGVGIGATLLALVVGSGPLVTAADFRPVFLLVALLPLVSAAGFLGLMPADGAVVSGHRAAAPAPAPDPAAAPDRP